MAKVPPHLERWLQRQDDALRYEVDQEWQACAIAQVPDQMLSTLWWGFFLLSLISAIVNGIAWRQTGRGIDAAFCLLNISVASFFLWSAWHEKGAPHGSHDHHANP